VVVVSGFAAYNPVMVMVTVVMVTVSMAASHHTAA
jgi:hypothetical protein